MKIRIWGARGSIPAPMTTTELRERLRETLQRSQGINLSDSAALNRFIERLPPYLNTVESGNTTCVELRVNNRLFILDMGSGIRMLGKDLMQAEFGRGVGIAHLFMSHTHWDHVEGFPFFTPAYVPGNILHFHSPFADLEWRLRQVMRHPFFPVDLDYPQAVRTYQILEASQKHEIEGVGVEILELHHPGGSFAYRFTFNNKVFVYATDGEYQKMEHEHTAPYEAFFKNADVLIFDAQYDFTEAITNKADWGHSTPKIGAELAWRAGVKRLVLTHHDPDSPAQHLWNKVDDADHHLRYRASRSGNGHTQPVEVLLAHEGLTIEI
ncbi:MAG: MBL fold metallo-hydrolase [Anaerolineae bacterium]|nr:MBL fold metallo-hydrolase [Anaerolineae bacterium]